MFLPFFAPFFTSATRILRLAYPLIIANVTIPLLAAVDTAVLGRLQNPSYLAAMAIGATIFSYLLWVCNFLRSGSAALNAQAVGGGDYHESARVLYRALAIAALLGLIILLFVRYPAWLVGTQVFEVTPEVSDFWGEYYDIRILSVPAALFNLVFIGWFLGSGRVYLTFATQALINILNIILDIIFVLGLDFAMAGAAWATVIAEYCGVAFACGVALACTGKPYRKQSAKTVMEWKHIKRLLALNFNVMLRTVILLSCLAWFTVKGSQLGTSVLAANAVLMNFFTFAAFALDGIADATQTLVGQEVGGKNKRRLSLAIRCAFGIAGLMALAFAMLYAVSFDSIIALLTDIPEVQKTAQTYAFWVIIIPISGVWCFVLDGIFLGLTQGTRLRNAMIASAISYFLILAIALPAYQNHGLWFSLNALLVLRALFLWLYYPKQYP